MTDQGSCMFGATIINALFLYDQSVGILKYHVNIYGKQNCTRGHPYLNFTKNILDY